MATMMIEKHCQESSLTVGTRSGIGFTLGLILGAAAGGLFSSAVSPARNNPDLWSALDLGLKLEQLRALKIVEADE